MNANTVISWLRTVSPIVAGAIITWAVAHGIGVTDALTQPLSVVLFAVFSAAYYTLARLLEKLPAPYGTWAGFLLAVPKQPAYHVPPAAPADPAPSYPFLR